MDKFVNETEQTMLLKEVYMRMQDEESKKIYRARSIFSLTDDRNFMTEIIRDMTISKTMLEQLAINKEKNNFIWNGNVGKGNCSIFSGNRMVILCR